MIEIARNLPSFALVLVRRPLTSARSRSPSRPSSSIRASSNPDAWPADLSALRMSTVPVGDSPPAQVPDSAGTAGPSSWLALAICPPLCAFNSLGLQLVHAGNRPPGTPRCATVPPGAPAGTRPPGLSDLAVLARPRINADFPDPRRERIPQPVHRELRQHHRLAPPAGAQAGLSAPARLHFASTPAGSLPATSAGTP